MRRQTPIANQLYEYLFPKPSSTDPPCFSAHLARSIVPEVRIEVATFYGDLNSLEARYPGLDYCSRPHRMRLGRFKHHKRLFDAFDTLGLTDNEIQEFCCWEGTKWARDRYEIDEGVKVVDTTGDEIGPWVDPRWNEIADEGRRKSITRQTDISVVVEEAGSSSPYPASSDAHDDQEMSDPPIQADHASLVQGQTASEAAVLHRGHVNRYLVAAWEHGYNLPPEIEQFLKEQNERGTLDNQDDLYLETLERIATAPPSTLIVASSLHDMSTMTM